LDAATLKDARPRRLTQAVAACLYEMTNFDGVTFTSRHGDDLQLWAIFEHPGDPPVTPSTHDVIGDEPLQHDSPEISKAFHLLGPQRGEQLGWTEPPISVSAGRITLTTT
jgi:hypothetical protein